jgi:hypothetical protein
MPFAIPNSADISTPIPLHITGSEERADNFHLVSRNTPTTSKNTQFADLTTPSALHNPNYPKSKRYHRTISKNIANQQTIIAQFTIYKGLLLQGK